MRPIWSIITEHLWDTFGLDWLCDEHKHATFLHAAVCAFGCSPARGGSSTMTEKAYLPPGVSCVQSTCSVRPL